MAKFFKEIYANSIHSPLFKTVLPDSNSRSIQGCQAIFGSVEGTTTALHPREVNGNERRSGKRRRSGDDIFSREKDDASTCKRRRMTSKSK